MELNRIQVADVSTVLGQYSQLPSRAQQRVQKPAQLALVVSWALPLHSKEWSISNFPCSLQRNITSHRMKNLAFQSLLRWKMIILSILTTSLIHFSLKGWEIVLFQLGSERVNHFTPKSDQCQISPAASPEISLHSTKNLAFHSLLRWKMIILPILTTSPIHFSLKVWENILFELRSSVDWSLCLFFKLHRTMFVPGITLEM